MEVYSIIQFQTTFLDFLFFLTEAQE